MPDAGSIPGGGEPLPSRILQIKAPLLPHLRFEWHPGTRRVYVIRLGAVPLVGDPIAFDIENHGQATNAVLIWTRGYRAARAEAALVQPKG